MLNEECVLSQECILCYSIQFVLVGKHLNSGYLWGLGLEKA